MNKGSLQGSQSASDGHKRVMMKILTLFSQIQNLMFLISTYKWTKTTSISMREISGKELENQLITIRQFGITRSLYKSWEEVAATLYGIKIIINSKLRTL
jgi:hypothetical protein